MDASGCFGAKCKDMKTQVIDNAKKCSVTKKVNEPLDECKFSPRAIFSVRRILIFSQGSRSSPEWSCPWKCRSIHPRAFALGDNCQGPLD